MKSHIEGLKVENDSQLITFRESHQKLQYQALKLLYNLPELFAIGGSPVISSYLMEELEFKLPILDLPPHIRCDMPIKGQSIFEQHQDYSYNLGSANSVTIWLPLQDTNVEHGALYVAQGTHLDGVYPNIKGVIDENYIFDFQQCPIALGEALIFDQKLVHKSGVNYSDQVRFSIQLRFTDLGCDSYAKSGYPINHKITTENYAQAALLPKIRSTKIN